jgi:predicted nuclease of predicted toxin-antitoxin system
MRFLLDQNAEARIATFLKEQGHDVTRIGQDYPKGLPDDEVLAIARREKRILITNDRDFGELVFRQQLSHAGILYLRLPLDADPSVKVRRLQEVLATQRAELDKFIVITPHDIRVRP